MAIGTSIFLLAVGAILRFAVYYSIRGIAIGVVGIVLMIAGALGLLLSFTVLSRTSRRRTVVQSGPTAAPGATTTVAREETYSDEPVNW
jgi:membrane-bound ClpP family serine protease